MNNRNIAQNTSPEKRFFAYLEELVDGYAKFKYGEFELKLQDLPESCQKELIGLYIEWSGRDLSECLYDAEDINNNFICALLGLLAKDTLKSRESIVEIMLGNLTQFYKNDLNDLLDQGCNDYRHQMEEENGNYLRYDMEHGDLIWGHS